MLPTVTTGKILYSSNVKAIEWINFMNFSFNRFSCLYVLDLILCIHILLGGYINMYTHHSIHTLSSLLSVSLFFFLPKTIFSNWSPWTLQWHFPMKIRIMRKEYNEHKKKALTLNFTFVCERWKNSFTLNHVILTYTHIQKQFTKMFLFPFLILGGFMFPLSFIDHPTQEVKLFLDCVLH